MRSFEFLAELTVLLPGPPKVIKKNYKPMSECTDDEIEAEAARRRDVRIKNKHKIKFCDECINFRIWYGPGEMPDHELTKVCNLGHTTKFIMPEHETDDDWGFYRVPCPDREIATGRKWPWQLEQEEAARKEQRHKDRIRRKLQEQWNEKLEARKSRPINKTK